MHLRAILLLCTVALGNSACTPDHADQAQSAPTPTTELTKPAPIARVDNVVDTYHGQSVTDPYQWLEDWGDAEVKQWTRDQTAYSRGYLDALPERPRVHQRIKELMTGSEAVGYGSLAVRGDVLMALKFDPALQQPQLVAMPVNGDHKAERVVFDANTFDPSGATAIDWYRPSHSGSLVAISLSSGGSERGDLHVFDVASGALRGQVIAYVQGGTAGGDIAWLPDDSGFFYTRYPRSGERAEQDANFYQQVYFHRLDSDPADDDYVLGKDFPRIAETRLFIHPSTGHLLVTVQDGDSNRFAHYLREPDGSTNRFSEFGDGLIQVVFGPDQTIYGISRTDQPTGSIIKMPLASPGLGKASVVVAATDAAVNHSFYSLYSPTLLVSEQHLFAAYQVGGPTELRVFDLGGKRLSGPIQEPVSTVFGLTHAGQGRVLFATMSYLSTVRWSAFLPARQQTMRLPISTKQTVDYSDVEVVREFATSKDGTKVPVNILMPKGIKRDGSRAIVVTGYGGYGISITPSMSRSRHILFENGALYAQANLRGGGEYGAHWHREGMLTNKQNVFDDFVAVIEHLVQRGYADPNRIGIVGGSNGGLLMGAVLTQRPELATAVVSHVGIYDSLRVELDPNGQFNIPEFGTVENPDHFDALLRYSPYHNVTADTQYPATMLPTGANDPRVNPAHSRKFAARLQAAQADKTGQAPILLRADEGTGHGAGTPLDKVVENVADQYSFFFHHLGIGGDAKTEY